MRHWGDVDWQQLEKDPDALIVDVREVGDRRGGCCIFIGLSSQAHLPQVNDGAY